MRTGLDALQIGIIVLVPIFMLVAAVHVARTDGTVRRLRLTPTVLVVERRLAWVIPLRSRVSLDAIEDICIVQHGAMAGSLTIATDDLVVAFGDHLHGKNFVAAYLAQWVAFSGHSASA